MYEKETPEKIKADIIDKISGDWDTREGSFADDMAGAIAVKLSNVYMGLGALPDMIWPNETSGAYLDNEAQDIGLTPRKPGLKAVATLQVTGTPGHVVPAGKTAMTDTGLLFDTLQDATLSESGTGTATVQAREVGESYNVPAGTILFQFTNDAGITSLTNPEAAAGGTNIESDAALYARIDAARKKPRTSGNANDYEAWALEVPGVGTAKCFPVYFGRGTVMVLVADENRKPLDGPIVEACAEHIESVMPCGGIELTVMTPETVAVGVSALVTTDGSVTIGSIRAAFVSSLESYFSEIALASRQVVYTKAGSILSGIPGVVDYSNLTLNGAAANITLTVTQVPTVGEVVIS